MTKVQMLSLSLAAVLAGPVHAQGCSGGNAGGMDATGNQCNWPSEVAASTTGPATSPPAKVIQLGRELASAAHPAIRLAKTSGQGSVPTAMAAPASRKLQAAAPPSVSAKTAKARPDRKHSARAARVVEWMSTALSVERLRQPRKSSDFTRALTATARDSQ